MIYAVKYDLLSIVDKADGTRSFWEQKYILICNTGVGSKDGWKKREVDIYFIYILLCCNIC